MAGSDLTMESIKIREFSLTGWRRGAQIHKKYLMHHYWLEWKGHGVEMQEVYRADSYP